MKKNRLTRRQAQQVREAWVVTRLRYVPLRWDGHRMVTDPEHPDRIDVEGRTWDGWWLLIGDLEYVRKEEHDA